MEIGLLQALMLGILAFFAGLDLFNGLTHFHRPVVLGPLVGLILGDLQTGILVGGTLELIWMGLAPLAGAQPPNVIIGHHRGYGFCDYNQSRAKCCGWCRSLPPSGGAWSTCWSDFRRLANRYLGRRYA